MQGLVPISKSGLTVLRYANQLDKSGTEIYEGDRLSYTYQIKEKAIRRDEDGVYILPDGSIDESELDCVDFYTVVFVNGLPYALQDGRNVEDLTNDDLLLNGEVFEVIGNVFEVEKDE